MRNVHRRWHRDVQPLHLFVRKETARGGPGIRARARVRGRRRSDVTVAGMSQSIRATVVSKDGRRDDEYPPAGGFLALSAPPMAKRGGWRQSLTPPHHTRRGELALGIREATTLESRVVPGRMPWALGCVLSGALGSKFDIGASRRLELNGVMRLGKSPLPAFLRPPDARTHHTTRTGPR